MREGRGPKRLSLVVVWGGGGNRIERDPNPIAFLPVPVYFLHFLHSPRLTEASTEQKAPGHTDRK